MLGGSIDIQSELGHGTEVKVVLPLIKQVETETPISTPSTMTSVDRAQDSSISILKARASGLSAALFGFDSQSTSDASITTVLRHYVASWYGLQLVDLNDASADIIIMDEEGASQLPSGSLRQNSSVIILCNSTSRHGQATVPNGYLHAVEYVSKPFGPYKLAKAIHMCLRDAENLRGQLQLLPGLSKSVERGESNTPTMDFQAMSLSSIETDRHSTADSSTTAIANDSTNAHLATTTPMPEAINPITRTTASGFPFPDKFTPARTFTALGEAESPWQESKRPSLRERKTDPTLPKMAWTDHEMQDCRADDKQEISPVQPLPAAAHRAPNILVVDDNKINLRLLKTFMAKRKYADVDAAENGKLAVQAFQQRQEGYNIIFMGKCSTCLLVQPRGVTTRPGRRNKSSRPVQIFQCR